MKGSEFFQMFSVPLLLQGSRGRRNIFSFYCEGCFAIQTFTLTSKSLSLEEKHHSSLKSHAFDFQTQFPIFICSTCSPCCILFASQHYNQTIFAIVDTQLGQCKAEKQAHNIWRLMGHSDRSWSQVLRRNLILQMEWPLGKASIFLSPRLCDSGMPFPLAS